MKKDKILNLVFMFFFGSITGWIWEVICTLFIYGLFENRGFLHGPWLPIYGTGLLLIVLLKKCVGKKPLFLFAAIIITCGCLEYFTGFLLENLYHTRWWNYRGEVWNINERVCLKSLLFFGIVGSMIAYKILPILEHTLNKIGLNKKKVLAAIMMLIVTIDFVFSIINPMWL